MLMQQRTKFELEMFLMFIKILQECIFKCFKNLPATGICLNKDKKEFTKLFFYFS